jgi:hypothetical protein
MPVQCRIVQCSAVQCSAVQCSAPRVGGARCVYICVTHAVLSQMPQELFSSPHLVSGPT